LERLGRMRKGEEGFTFVEVLLSTGLLALCVMGFMSTVMMAIHVVQKSKANDAMDLIAHNALIDLYAVSAYDNGARAALLRQTRNYEVTQPATHAGAAPVSYTVHVRVYPAAPEEIDASVRVSDAFGNTTTMHGVLAPAEPAPGSTFTPTYMPPSVLRAPL